MRAVSCGPISASVKRPTRSLTRAVRGSAVSQNGSPFVSGWLHAGPGASGGPGGGMGGSQAMLNTESR